MSDEGEDGGIRWQVERHAVLGSTSAEATGRIRAGRAEAGQVIVAESQTAGHGRRGRRWHGGPGALLFTAILPAPGAYLNRAALAAATAVARGLRQCDASAGLKWPNDVLLDDRKVAGVLVEVPAGGMAAIGVGVNVNNEIPPEGIDGVRATSMRAHLGREVPPDEVLDRILEALREMWGLVLLGRLGALRAAWSELDVTTGRRVRLLDGSEGVAVGIHESAALRVRRDAGGEQLLQIDQVSFLD